MLESSQAREINTVNWTQVKESMCVPLQKKKNSKQTAGGDLLPQFRFHSKKRQQQQQVHNCDNTRVVV